MLDHMLFDLKKWFNLTDSQKNTVTAFGKFNMGDSVNFDGLHVGQEYFYLDSEGINFSDPITSYIDVHNGTIKGIIKIETNYFYAVGFWLKGTYRYLFVPVKDVKRGGN